MIKPKVLIILAFAFLLICGTLQSQTPTVASGKIIGKITDETGAALPGVSVVAESPKLIGKSSTVTDVYGVYRLFALPPGDYTITYSLQGFNTVVRKDIILHIDETLTINITMTLGKIEEQITVTGTPPLIDVKSTTKGMTITKQVFDVLPRGRNFDTLTTIVPGVNSEPWLGGISVDGASAAENLVYIDGTDTTRNDVGLPRMGAVFEFIDEIQIVASGYNAEYGGALGGVINVVTRQGGNEYHGEIIGYLNSSWLTGNERDSLRLNPFDITKAEYVNYQTGKGLPKAYGKDKWNRFEGGLSLGGYILKDRLWFFGSVLPVYQPTKRHVEFLTTPPVIGDYTSKSYAYNFQGKITAQPFRFMRVGASFVNNFTKWRKSLPPRDGTGSPTDPRWERDGYDYPGWNAQGFADLTFGNNLMINIRGGRFFYDTTNQQFVSTEPRWFHYGDGTAKYPSIPSQYQRPRGWQNYGRSYEFKKYIKYKNYLSADFTYYMNLGGEHAFKFGGSWFRQGEDADRTITNPEIWLWWGRPRILGGVNYGIGTYGHYEVRGDNNPDRAGPFGEFFKVYNDRWAFYLQDSWTIADKLTLNLGLRAESEYVPPYSADPSIPKGFRPIEFEFGDKLSPRLGLIYDVFGDTSLKVFGNYGLYYDVIKTYMPAHSYAGFKWKSAYYTLDTYEWDKIGVGGIFPGKLLAVYDWRYPSFESTDIDLKPVSQREIALGVEKKLMENLSATVRFVQKHLRRVIEDVGVLVPGVGEQYYETNPGFGYSLWTTHGGKMDPNYWETPKAKREYYAINFSLDKRFSNNWLAGFSYTWSRLEGNFSGLGSSDEYGRTSPYVERSFDNWAMSYTKNGELIDGPLPTDRPHQFKFWGAYTFPFPLTVSAVVFAMSGKPFTETWTYLDAFQYPFNRFYYRDENGKLQTKRTPFTWFGNVYAEYNLKVGKYKINFNLNVDNIFDIKTAQRLYAYRTLYGLSVSEAMILAKNWDLTTPNINYVPNALFMKETDFYGPISARLGVKFIF
ncbi:MAG: TonB-dependent receptor [Acidobacteriota bacterium]